jgi:hypothetical protein
MNEGVARPLDGRLMDVDHRTIFDRVEASIEIRSRTMDSIEREVCVSNLGLYSNTIGSGAWNDAREAPMDLSALRRIRRWKVNQEGTRVMSASESVEWQRVLSVS